MKKLILVLIAALIVTTGFFVYQQNQKNEKITSFEECAAAGFEVMESYPARCVTSNGRSFTQNIGNELQFTELIVVSNPRPNQKISSPLQISGRARGSWYFEASFPSELVDANNKSLAKGFAQAQGEWMTEEFVQFTGELSFEKPQTKKGKLIIKNANPSGLEENQNELVIPVTF